MTRTPKSARRREALYRYLVIAPLLPPQLDRKERGRRIAGILKEPPRPPDGSPTPPLSKRTIHRWLELYQKARKEQRDPLEALEPKVRDDHGKPRKIAAELLSKAIVLRQEWPRFSLKSILERVDHPDRGRAARRSLARAFLQAGYDRRDKRRRIAARDQGPRHEIDWDLQDWEADFPNDLWQVDSTPSIWLAAGRHREQPVHLQLVNIIDDHSRLVVGGGFVERLRVVDLLELLVPAITRYGCPSLLYADQAKIHKSAILVEGLPRIGGHVVLGTVGHAPGHGKIERLHQTVESTLIEDLRRSPVETAAEATRKHQLWRERNAEEAHTTTGEPPRTRWERILGNARIPREEELRWAFRGEHRSQITEVGAIRLHGQKYEAPASHRRSRPYMVTVRYDLLDTSTIWIEDDDGTRHPCPLYRTRSHTERRVKRGAADAPGLSFRALFDAERHDDSTPQEEPPPCT
jgi:putative transposase